MERSLLKLGGYKVICFQETRTNGPFVRNQTNYISFSFGCLCSERTHDYGCDILISRVIVHGKLKVVPQDHHVVCIHDEPRILYAFVCCGDLYFHVVVVHCPYKKCLHSSYEALLRCLVGVVKQHKNRMSLSYCVLTSMEG